MTGPNVFNSITLILALGAGLFVGPGLTGQANADANLFAQQCGVCHTLNAQDAPRQGPTLDALFGRKAGAVENFPYSNSLKSLNLSWNTENLDQWMIRPQDIAEDSYMMYSQKDAVVRAAIIQFLKSQ